MRSIFGLVFLSLFGLPAAGAAAAWKAQWIWLPGVTGQNTWACLRKQVTLDAKPATAVARIAAENKYWLYVNGTLVVQDGGLDARPDFNNTYFDQIDLAPYLRAGRNTLAARVWYKGGLRSYSQITMGKGGFLFEAALTGAAPAEILSDQSWKITQDVAFRPTTQQKQLSDYKWLSFPIEYDATQEIGPWQDTSFVETGSWTAAGEAGIPPVAPWNDLKPRTIPFWKDYGKQAFTNQASLPAEVSANITVTGDLGINIQGSPYLKLDAPAGVRVRITLNDFYSYTYTTKAGIQEFDGLAWQNSSGHNVQFQFSNVTGKVKILDIKFHRTGYDADLLGTFSSSDTSLNNLWIKSRNTSQVCMRDIFYDCPNRERGQWWGDVSEQILYSFYLYDSRSQLLAVKAYRELMATQKPDGSLYTTAPGDVFHLPDQNLAAVSMLWDYFMYTGDTALVTELYPGIKRFVQYNAANTDADGMLIAQPSNGFKLWNWIDWGAKLDIKDGSAITVANALYARLLGSAVELAKISGNGPDTAYYGGLRRKVAANFKRYFWNDAKQAYVFHNQGGGQSLTVEDRANGWAVLSGLADAAGKAGAQKLLQTEFDASPYQEMYIEQAMFLLSPADAVKRMRTRYDGMIKSWSSTLWEEFPANKSNNHAWSAGPVFLLGAYLAGIRPLEPGFRRFLFQPALTDVKRVAVSVPSPKGLIQASANAVDAGRYLMDLTVPAGAQAEVAVPRAISPLNRIVANGAIVWKLGTYRNGVPGVAASKADSQSIRFQVEAGKWVFEASKDTAEISVGTAPRGPGEHRFSLAGRELRILTEGPFFLRVVDENGRVRARRQGQAPAIVALSGPRLGRGIYTLELRVGRESLARRIVLNP